VPGNRKSVDLAWHLEVVAQQCRLLGMGAQQPLCLYACTRPVKAAFSNFQDVAGVLEKRRIIIDD
jgi:hypothetical protein